MSLETIHAGGAGPLGLPSSVLKQQRGWSCVSSPSLGCPRKFHQPQVDMGSYFSLHTLWKSNLKMAKCVCGEGSGVGAEGQMKGEQSHPTPSVHQNTLSRD